MSNLPAEPNEITLLRLAESGTVTEEMCQKAVAAGGWALRLVPEGLRTRELCLQALSGDGQALAFVPHALRDPEMCSLAVRNDGMAMNWVPLHLMTFDLCRQAVGSNGMALRLVPKELMNQTLCQEAVVQEPQALKWVPQELRTADLCRTAVSKWGDLLYEVPGHLRDREMCLLALRQNPNVGIGVPAGVFDEALAHQLIEKGASLRTVAEPYRTHAVCLAAIKADAKNHFFVPSHIKTRKLYRDYCGVLPAKIWCLFTKDKIPKSVALAIVTAHPRFYEQLPARLQTPDVAAAIPKPKAPPSRPAAQPPDETEFSI